MGFLSGFIAVALSALTVAGYALGWGLPSGLICAAACLACGFCFGWMMEGGDRK